MHYKNGNKRNQPYNGLPNPGILEAPKTSGLHLDTYSYRYEAELPYRLQTLSALQICCGLIGTKLIQVMMTDSLRDQSGCSDIYLANFTL